MDSLIANIFSTGIVIAALIIANAPTWGWIGIGFLTWLVVLERMERY